MRFELLNGSNLAYIGDAYYELKVREYLINHNITKNKELQKMSIYFVSASSQAMIMNNLLDILNEEEKKIYLRGRNGVHHVYRKNVDQSEYIVASGFEALIGYLYLKKDTERLDFLMQLVFETVEKNNDNLWEKYRSRSTSSEKKNQ